MLLYLSKMLLAGAFKGVMASLMARSEGQWGKLWELVGVRSRCCRCYRNLPVCASQVLRVPAKPIGRCSALPTATRWSG